MLQQDSTSSCTENSLKEQRQKQGVQLGDHCNNSGLYHSGSGGRVGAGEKGSDPGHISEVEPIGFSDGLDVESEQKRGIRKTLRFFI